MREVTNICRVVVFVAMIILSITMCLGAKDEFQGDGLVAWMICLAAFVILSTVENKDTTI